MAVPITPRPGFRWDAINWGGPDEPRIVLDGLADVERGHPHRRGARPRGEARAAHGPPRLTARTEGRGPPTAGTGRDAVAEPARKLRREPKHDFAAVRRLDFVSDAAKKKPGAARIEARLADLGTPG